MKKFYVLLVVLFLVSSALAQWEPQTSNTTNNFYSVYFTDAHTGYAVGDTGTIIKTKDGGANWTAQSSGTNQNLRSVFFTGEETGYAVGDSGKILKTTNGGTLWTNELSGISGCLKSVFFTDSDTGYAAFGDEYADSIYIIKTTNGGTIWSIIYADGSLDYAVFLNSVYFINANTGFAVGGYRGANGGWGIILKTIDGGTTWTSSETSDPLYSINFPNSNIGYAVGGDWAVLNSMTRIISKTIDGGITWSSVLNEDGGILNSVYFTDADTGYAVGGLYSIGIILTIDGGTTWTASGGTSNGLNSVYFTDATTGYAVGENGTILKTINGGGLNFGFTDLSVKSSSLKIYPNPSSSLITISTPTTPNKSTFLTIYSISNQQLINRRITEQHSVVDVSGLPQGVYLVKISDESKVQVGKIVRQ